MAGIRPGPASKLYLAETKGDTQIQTGDRIFAARQATSFDAPGTIIETKADAHNAFVYSNGTGLYIDENSRVAIERFVQESFRPDRESNADSLSEPSVSQSNVYLFRGMVGLCTSRLVSGSSMTYATPHAIITIRGGRVAITCLANETIVDLLEGDVTVRAGDNDRGGRILQPGERAVIHPQAAGQPLDFSVGPISPEARQAADARIGIACNARKTVSFETIDSSAGQGPGGPGGTQEIVAKPAVPERPAANIVVSPDRLPGT